MAYLDTIKLVTGGGGGGSAGSVSPITGGKVYKWDEETINWIEVVDVEESPEV
jgi:hypothetical protein